MTTLQLEPEQKKAIETEISPALEQARSLVVRNQEERGLAAAFIERLKQMKDKIEERFHPTANKKKAYAVYEDLLETEKAFYDPINTAIEVSRKTVREFDTAETLRIQREQREAQEKREQQEREETAKRDAEARAAIEAEEVAKIDNEMQQVKADTEQKIEEIQKKAEETPAIKMDFKPTPLPTKKLVWKARVTNMMKLCRSISNGEVPYSVLEVRPSDLSDFAKKYDGKTKIEGLEFYQESTGRI